MPWVRAVATISASPVLAPQAEKVNRNIGNGKYNIFSCFVHNVVDKNRVSIIPSKHSRADRR